MAANARATVEAADPNAWALEEDASIEDKMDDDARFAAEHLLLSSRFSAPFVGERIYPRIALGTSLLFSQDGDGGALDGAAQSAGEQDADELVAVVPGGLKEGEKIIGSGLAGGGQGLRLG